MKFFIFLFALFPVVSFADSSADLLYKLNCAAVEPGQGDASYFLNFAKLKDSPWEKRAVVTAVDAKTQAKVFEEAGNVIDGGEMIILTAGYVSISISREDRGTNQPRGNMCLYNRGQRSFTLYCSSR